MEAEVGGDEEDVQFALTEIAVTAAAAAAAAAEDELEVQRCGRRL